MDLTFSEYAAIKIGSLIVAGAIGWWLSKLFK